ncbi:MAG TPA: DUF2252 family protein [Candidatus Dormibacteraeota bacterium]|jgi:hypothetical protein|nr:DUF2252 family protein [Candidatus Dormibacteraeota bacterium]
MPKPAVPGKKKFPGIVEATADFEKWLAKHLPIVKQDLKTKHEQMALAAFPFFRATFYRWLQLWPHLCSDLASAPSVLAVGDLHIENFGTWRDLEGRLIWGVNDLDEAWPCAYTIDLVRLATSVYLAVEEEHLCLRRRRGAEAIEEGYRAGIECGGEPFILAEKHQWLRLMALSELRDPVHFWTKMTALPAYKGELPQEVRKLIEDALPEPKQNYQLRRRVAGLGSLGHPRILALTQSRGAWIAREAKAIRPSAWVWAEGANQFEIFGAKLAESAVRVRDPFVGFSDRWLVRRLAPDCSRIELASLPQERDEEKLLYAMGREIANMHLGSTKSIPAIKNDLTKRKGRWLHKASKEMLAATLKDWKDWHRGAQ